MSTVKQTEGAMLCAQELAGSAQGMLYLLTQVLVACVGEAHHHGRDEFLTVPATMSQSAGLCRRIHV